MSRLNIASNSLERTIFQPKKHFDKFKMNAPGSVYRLTRESDYIPIKLSENRHVEKDSLAYIKYNGLDLIRFSHLQMLINAGRVNSIFKNYFSTTYELDDSDPIFPPRRFGKCVCPNCCAYYGHSYRETGITRSFNLPDITFCPGSIRRWVFSGSSTPLKGPRHCVIEANRYRDSYRSSRHNKFDPMEFPRSNKITTRNVTYRTHTHNDTPHPAYHFFKGFFVHERIKVETIVWYPRIRYQGVLQPYKYGNN